MTHQKRTTVLISAGAGLIAFLLFLPALGNGFLEWDDGTYVTDNPYLVPLSVKTLKWALLAFHSSNWHPLTWLSHALDLAVWGLNPLGHHLTSIILHSLNSAIVVLLSARLVKVWQERNLQQVPATEENGTIVAAGVTGLLFAVHPLHVESVAWIAERKDVLCSFFFLLALLAYLHDRYRKLCLPLFILALLSKPMAITLPIVLLLLDWFPLGRLNDRKSMRSALLEKIPFLVLSLGSAIMTVLAQAAGGSISSVEAIPLYARVAVAVRALTVYLWKTLLPLGLSPFYPYPQGRELFSLPSLAVMVATIAIGAATVIAIKRTRIYAAVFAYFVITLLPVLGLVQVGRQAMADRYMYLPGLAPLFLLGFGAWWLASRKGWGTGKVTALACIISVFLSVITLRQIPLWHDGISLWSRVIAGGGNRLDFAYNNRAVAYHRQGDLVRAEADLTKAIEVNQYDADYFSNRGTIYLKLNRFDDALSDFLKAMSIDPSLPGPYYNTACIFSLRNDTETACYWLGRSISHGYDRWGHMRTDPDLENLRATSCFRTLMASKISAQ